MNHLFLNVALLLSSACGLVVEIVAGRLIAPYVGMSLYTWTAIIAVVLTGLSVGHWIGGRMADGEPTPRQSYLRLAVSLGLAAVSSLASLLLIRLIAEPLVSGGLSPVAAVIALCSALFLLPSLFVGIVAPIVTKLAIDLEPARAGAIIGRMFAIGTLGSIAGTLGAGYLFISWIGSTGTIIAVTVIYAGLAAVSAFLGSRAAATMLSLALALVIGGGVMLGQMRDAFTSPCLEESDYFCIRVDDFSRTVGRESALMALDNLVHSINDREDPSLLYSPYVHFVDEYARRRFFRRQDGLRMSAYFIGGGGFSLPRSWAVTMENPSLLVAEIDPVVTRVAAERMWLDPKASGLEIVHQDARSLLQSLPEEPRFDVIFGDAFHDISIPAHLVTREFHREIASRLRPRGFYVINAVDQRDNPRFLAALVATLKQDFKVVEVWAEEAELAPESGAIRVTYTVVASDRGSFEQRMTSIFGIERSWRMVQDAPHLKLLVDGSDVLTDSYAPVERLLSDLL